MKKNLIALVLSAGFINMLAPSTFAADQMAAGNEQQGQVIKFYDEVMNQHKLDAADQYIASNAIDHDQPMDPKKSAIENFKLFMAMMHTGFPDMKVKVEDVISQGDKVVVRFHLTGTNKGQFMGMKATNKPIDMMAVDIFRVANGKFVEHWGFMDSGMMMQQLGMMH